MAREIKMYKTMDEAESSNPKLDGWRLYSWEVAKDGISGFAWAPGRQELEAAVAREHGLVITVAKPKRAEGLLSRCQQIVDATKGVKSKEAQKMLELLQDAVETERAKKPKPKKTKAKDAPGQTYMFDDQQSGEESPEPLQEAIQDDAPEEGPTLPRHEF